MGSRDPKRLLAMDRADETITGYMGDKATQVFLDIESEQRIVVHGVSEVLFSGRSEFQKVDLFRTGHLGKVLALDEIIQVAQKDEALYHELLVHPAACAMDNPASALVLGGGDGCAARELRKHDSIKDLKVVDLDSMVIEACKETMSDINDNALSDPLVKVIVSEAREYLIRNELETHDLIIADLTEPYDSAGSGGELSRQLFSRRFYDRVKGMLTPERGIFVIQTGGLTFVERVDRLRKEIVQGLNAVFRNVKTFYQYIHSFDMVWTITVCSDRDYDWDRFDPEPALEQRNIFDLKHYDRLSHLAATIAPRNMRELFGQ